MEKTRVTLPNGMVIEGTPDQLIDMVKKLGMEDVIDLRSGYYKSSTQGWVKISEMNTMHLRNAILKQYKEWVDDMHKIKNPRELVKMITDGISDKTWLAMLVEYSKRREE